MDLAPAPGVRAGEQSARVYWRHGTGLALADGNGDAVHHHGDALAGGRLQHGHLHRRLAGGSGLFVRIRQARRGERNPAVPLYYLAAAAAYDVPGQHDVDHRGASAVRPGVRIDSGRSRQRHENAGIPDLSARLQPAADGLCFGAGVRAGAGDPDLLVHQHARDQIRRARRVRRMHHG
ncbi:hypothetical protein BN871_GU_00020 [Paenibacillus sp. P22]|nr:hypothetical protein BN871_GU_00020 [Paenibacillus sp. P22]